MNLLLDTNVILDALLARPPFVNEAAVLFSAAESGRFHGFVRATTITTTHYLARKAVGTEAASQAIGRLLSIFSVAPVTESVLRGAMQSGFSDFEDGVLHASARSASAQGIVTRNTTDFTRATLPVYEPAQAIALLFPPSSHP